MKNIIIILLMLLLLLAACSVNRQNESSTMVPDYGKLKLVGDPTGRSVTLNGEAVALDPEREVNIFELQSGSYSLEISYQGSTILSRTILISTGQTNEVKMP